MPVGSARPARNELHDGAAAIMAAALVHITLSLDCEVEGEAGKLRAQF
jgi:hypothetical protein